MNLKSKIYIGIIAFSLAAIVAVVAARRIHSVWLAPEAVGEEELALDENAGYYPFVEEQSTNPDADLPNRMMVATEGEAAYVPEREIQKPFFSGQIDLPALAKEQESYSNADFKEGDANISIGGFKNNEEAELKFDKYPQDPMVKQFVKDMQKAMGNDGGQKVLSPQEMTDKILNNPQMQKILLEYSKNPQIMKMADEMMKNAQAVQNVSAQQSGKVNKN